MRYLSGGESHGYCLTGIIEGLPAGLELSTAEINRQLERRQKGYGRGARMAIEHDRVKILSGLRFNRTIGSPLTLQIKNRDWKNWRQKMALEGRQPEDMTLFSRPRPGHADLAGGLKYDYDDLRLVLERASARETAIRVAVGTVGRIFLSVFGVSFISHVVRIGPVNLTGNRSVNELVTLAEQIEKSALRCIDPQVEVEMVKAVKLAEEKGDTLGGIIELVVTGVPPGLGSYMHWDNRLDGRLAGAIMSIPGIKGVEIGVGFSGSALHGSKIHDSILSKPGQGIYRPTNRAGGLEGGITNGEPLLIRVAMKPIPTLQKPLPSIDWITGKESPAELERSDVCAVPSAAVVVEAVAAWTLAAAFCEKFAGDSMDEVEAAYHYYMEKVQARLHSDRSTGDKHD